MKNTTVMSARFAALLLISILLALVGARSAAAQAQTGTPPFSTVLQQGGPDKIDPANLNVSFGMPIFSRPGRGLPFNFALSYNSSIWSPQTVSGHLVWVPANGFGWGQSLPSPGTLNYSQTSTPCYGSDGFGDTTEDGIIVTANNFTYIDASGTPHPTNASYEWFNVWGSNTYEDCPAPGQFSSASFATDGSGYYVDPGTGTFLTYDRSGVKYDGATITDPNGNQITVGSGGAITDTLGTSPLSSVWDGNALTYTYTYPTVGSTANVVFRYAYMLVATNFACSGVTENNSGYVLLPSELDLPDGSKYLFTYETTPSNSSAVTGRLASITLPTGGAISYTYPGANDSINCSDGTTLALTRQTPDGTWRYSRSIVSGAQSTSTITDPVNDQTVMNFQGIYLTQEQDKDPQSNLQRTLYRCYSSSSSAPPAPPCDTTALTPPFSEIQSYLKWPNNLESMTDTKYNTSSGVVAETDEYDYGNLTTPLRRTVTSYATLGNIFDHPSQVTVYAGNSSTPSAQTTYGYDQSGLTSTSVPQHVAVSGSRGNVTTVTSLVQGSATISSTTAYYDTGTPHVATDPNGNQTQFAYSSNGVFITQVTNALSQTTSAAYDSSTGLPTSATDANLQPTYYSYDSLLRPTQVNFPDGGQTTIGYQNPNVVNASQKIDASRYKTGTVLFDSLGRQYQTQLTSDPEGTDYVDTTYDSLGRVSSVSNPHRSGGNTTDGTTTYAYDALSRVIQITDQDGSASHVSYSANCATASDEAGKTRVSCTDGLGRLTSVAEDPNGLNYPTAYAYDALDNLTATSQSGSRQRAFTYDSLSRLLSASNPESGTTTYTYDANGNVLTRTDARHITTTYAYDPLNRLTVKTYSDPSMPTPRFFYDCNSVWGDTLQNPVGRLCATNRWDNVNSLWISGESLSYDSMGRIIRHRQCAPVSCAGTPYTLDYVYDLLGDVTSYTNGFGTTFTQMFDSVGRAMGVTSNWVDAQHPANLVAVDPGVGYYPTGAVRKMTYGNGITEAVSIEPRLQPCHIDFNTSGSIVTDGCADGPMSGQIQDFAYAYGAWGSTNNGNITIMNSWGVQNSQRNYTYDGVNRLSAMTDTVTSQPCRGLSWIYDAWGNRTDQTPTAGTCNPFHAAFVDTGNRVHDTNSTYQYDASGNMTNDGSHSYTYDAENRVTAVDGGSTASYAYDAEGNRIEKVTGSTKRDYIYDVNGTVMSEWCTNCAGYTGGAAGYVYFNGSLAAEYEGSTLFLHSDHLGSTRLVTGMPQMQQPNVDFESGSTGWSLSNATVISDSTRAHSGNNYVQISAAPGGQGTVMGQSLAVNQGDQLSFGGWSYVETGAGGGIGWWLLAEDVNHNAVNYIGAGWPPPSGWTFNSNTYTVPAGVAYVQLYATVYMPTSSTTMRFDDGFLYDNRSGLQVAECDDYLPFGEKISCGTTGLTTHLFTGYERDAETNLDDANARYYSNSMGRFMSPDPAGLLAVDPTNPQSWNQYSYVINNPMTFVDPTGMDHCEAAGDFNLADSNGIDPNSGPDACGIDGGTWVADGCDFDAAFQVTNCGPDLSGGGGVDAGGGGGGGSSSPAPALGASGPCLFCEAGGMSNPANIWSHSPVPIPGQGVDWMNWLFGAPCSFTGGSNPCILSAGSGGNPTTQIKSLYENILEHLEKIEAEPESLAAQHWRAEIENWTQQILKKAQRRPGSVDKYLQRVIGISGSDLENLLSSPFIIVDPCVLDPRAPYCNGGLT